MRPVLVAVVLVCIVPLVVQGESTSPRRDRKSTAERSEAGPRTASAALPPQNFSEEEWNKAVAFMHEHSPKRLEAYQRLTTEQQNRLRSVIFNRYWTMQRLAHDEPEIYQLRLKRLPLEDRIFELSREMRNAPAAVRRAKHDELEARISEWFDKGLEEQQMRIGRLDQQLQGMKKRLQEEKSQREQIIVAKVQAVEDGRNLGNLGAFERTPDRPMRLPDGSFASPKDPSRPGPTTAPSR